MSPCWKQSVTYDFAVYQGAVACCLVTDAEVCSRVSEAVVETHLSII